MKHKLALPGPWPKPGFYYHYKHDPAYADSDFPDAALQNYAYEVLPGLGHFTEEDPNNDPYRVKYIPLYPWAAVYEVTQQAGFMTEDHRPLKMFMGDAVVDGVTQQRFTPITDPEVIAKLTVIRDEMYADYPRLW